MERRVVHLDLDTFFVSVERQQNSKLVGIPLLIGGTSDRGVVASCSYEARQFGIHSAMPMKLALRLCPHATVVRGDHDNYSKYSRMVTEILREKAPVVEKASIDEHYLDLTGMDKYFGCFQWTKELRQTIIKETGLPISFGLSSNKTVSKVATGQAKPNGEKNVDIGTEKSFLAPLSIRKIPMVGEKAFLKLKNMRILKVATVQQMPVATLYRILGENGTSIWNKCNGIDPSLVIPYHEAKSMSKEETFDRDTIDVALLRKIIITMADTLAFDLRKENRLTGCITVKIRYSNWDTHTQQIKINYTSSTKLITEKALQLFEKVFTRRMSLRLIGMKLSHLVSGSYQIDLFNDAVTDINLCRAMDSIRNRFGSDKVLKAISLR